MKLFDSPLADITVATAKVLLGKFAIAIDHPGRRQYSVVPEQSPDEHDPVSLAPGEGSGSGCTHQSDRNVRPRTRVASSRIE
jgi:hypothetical protein